MLVLISISLLIILSYSIAVCIKGKKIPRSISATWYAIEHKWWFRFSMWVTPMLAIPAIVDISTENTAWLGFISLLGMILVGCAPDFKNDLFQRRLHLSGAILLLSGTQMWIVFNYPLLLLVWLAYILYTVISISIQKNRNIISRFYNTNPMFWVEMCAMNVFVALFIKYF